jgi:hypothetical protein
MNASQVKALLEAQKVSGEPAHVSAAVSAINSMLRATDAHFAALPLEAEPSGFQAEQRRNAP